MVKTLSEINERKVIEVLGITEKDGEFIAWFNYEKEKMKGLTTGIMMESHIAGN